MVIISASLDDIGLAKKKWFGFFYAIVWKNPNELFGQPSQQRENVGS